MVDLGRRDGIGMEHRRPVSDRPPKIARDIERVARAPDLGDDVVLRRLTHSRVIGRTVGQVVRREADQVDRHGFCSERPQQSLTRDQKHCVLEIVAQEPGRGMQKHHDLVHTPLLVSSVRTRCRPATSTTG
jgi:hypothetical protein